MRRLPILLAILALPLLLVACRDNGGNGVFADPAEAIELAGQRVAEQDSFKFEFNASFDVDESSDDFMGALIGDGVNMEGKGQFDLANNRSHIRMNVIFFDMEMIQDGDECYTRSAWTGDLWQREDCDDDEFDTDDFFFGDDPTSILDAFSENVEDIEDLGEDEVRGVTARHYRVMATDPELAEEMGSMDAIPFDIWIDEEGRPVKVRMEFDVEDDGMLGGDSGETMTMAMEFSFFDWGEPVDIQVPSEDEIGDGAGLFDDWEDDLDWDDGDDFDWPFDDDDMS